MESVYGHGLLFGRQKSLGLADHSCLQFNTRPGQSF